MEFVLGANWQCFFISVLVAAIYALQLSFLFPFSGYSPDFNYEIISTHLSTQIFLREGFSFPLGVVQSLTYPYKDANIANTGAIPLFALFQKLIFQITGLGARIWLYPVINITAVFFLSFFAQKTLLFWKINSPELLFLGAFFVALSPPVLIKTVAMQSYCVAAFALYAWWLYRAIKLLDAPLSWLNCVLFGVVFSVSALIDSYALVGIFLGSSVILVFLFFAWLCEVENNCYRFIMFLFSMLLGAGSAILLLYIIGMFPLPITSNFTSYDFGMGGRYHVADLFSLLIPYKDSVFAYPGNSLLSFILPSFSTDLLAGGQYEGVGYIGTVPVFAMLSLFFVAVILAKLNRGAAYLVIKNALRIPNIGLISIAVFSVFAFSLGYELHIFGHGFPTLNIMPAAILADMFPALYNIRAPGRLIALPVIFVLLLLVVALYHIGLWLLEIGSAWSGAVLNRSLILVVLLIHLLEVYPFLLPIDRPSEHFSYSVNDIKKINQLSEKSDAIFFVPSVKAQPIDWTAKAYWFSYHANKPSNIYYTARAVPRNENASYKTIAALLRGDFRGLYRKFGSNVLIVSRQPIQNIDYPESNELDVHEISGVYVYKLNS